MADRLVIEIDGNASGLTKALSTAQSRLTQFNTNVSNGNKALTSFLSKINSTAAGIGRLSSAANNVRSSLSTLNASINSTNSAIARLTKEASAGATALRGFGTALGSAQRRLEGLSAASAGAGTSMTSLNRRLAALGATVTATNAQMRTFMRTMTNSTGTMRGGTTIVNNYGRSVSGAGEGANRASGMFGRLNRANITLMEGFRRHVAQITALRTITYQAIFWFGPLVYSIIKVNAQYEKQMQLLKNLSGQTSELAKTQWALQTRQQLVQLANTNPFSLDQITESFVRMKVSGLDPLNGGLQTLMDSIAAFGGSNDELQRAGIALQQMVGKSAVSMEELRQQLGEHIPDAMKAMAAGMGLSMAKFYKAVQSGTVEARSAIHNMLVVLNADHRGAALQMMNTWNGLMARMSTAWQNFVAKLEHSTSRNSFIDTLKQKVSDLMLFLNTPAGMNFFVSVDNALSNAVRTISNIIQIIYEWRSQIILAAKIFAVMWGGKLVLGTLTSVVQLFLSGLRGIIFVLKLFTNGVSVAANVTAAFSGAVRSAATALGIATTAAGGAEVAISALLSTMAIAVGVALALAGATWAVVAALNAKTDAEKNAELQKKAEQGGTFATPEEEKTERDRLLKLKSIADTGKYWTTDANGNPVQAPVDPITRAKARRDYNQGAIQFNRTRANTANANVSAVNYKFDAAQPDPYAKTRARFNDLESKVDVNSPDAGKQMHDLETQKTQALAQDAQNEINRLQALKSTTKDPTTIAAIDARIDRINGDKRSFMEPFVEQQYIQGKKKPKHGNHKLESAQNAFENQYVQTADLQHQLDDLVGRTDTEFNQEAAQEAAKQAARGKTIEQLRDMARAEKQKREELQKSIKVEKAVIDIENEASNTTFKTKQAVEDLLLGYESIDTQVKHYHDTLIRQHQTEMTIAEDRVKQNRATTEQIEQYLRLKNAIDAAVRAKQAELVVEIAKEAKDVNEEYKSKLRTPTAQFNHDTLIELEKYNEALKRAYELASMSKQIDADIEDAKIKLAEANQRLAEATDDSTKAQANHDITVIASRIHDDEAAKAAAASIPFLKERIDILNQEMAIRNKLSGAGGPLMDWAIPAKQAFDDLGNSVGSLFTSQMDSFIESLAEGKMAFGDFVKSILKGIILIIIRGLIAKAILSALGFTSSASMGSIDMTGYQMPLNADAGVPVGHTGMIAGGTGRSYRSVDPAMFSFAERYHTGGIVGLRPNEVPIIAKRGEGVFTEEQMKALGQPQPNNVQVNVINQTGVQADAQRGQPQFDGEKWVETIMLKKMSSPGPVRDGLNALTKR